MSACLLGKENVGLIIDRIGLTNNKIQINIEKQINPNDLYIYWIGETEYTRGTEHNQMLIYHTVLQSDIPSSYGKNKFIIKYQDKTSDKIAIFKKHAFSKYNYTFNCKLENDVLIVSWSIINWYDADNKGSVTIEL